MADFITIVSNEPNIVYGNLTDTYGGKQINIGSGFELTEMIKWYRAYKDQLEKESKAREKFESVASAYDQYQTTLKLVLDQI